MLYVIARIEARPGRYRDVEAALLELARASRLESGCIRYDVLADAAGNLFVTREEWLTAEDERAHMGGAAVAAAFAAVRDALASAPDILRLGALTVTEA